MGTYPSRSRRRRNLLPGIFLLLVLTLFLLLWGIARQAGGVEERPPLKMTQKSGGYSAEGELPQELQELWERNEEARDFVEDYWEKRDQVFDIDLSELADCDEVPLLLQWDERWGYQSYSGDLLGLTGCGPTCLSMAAIYLTGDTSLDPGTVAAKAEEWGYAVPGNGSAWTLISEGASRLGMEAEELPLSEQRMRTRLEKGELIICVVGKGDFTSSGHFLVLVGATTEGFLIRDPNSPERSGQVWSYDRLSGQIRNLWALKRG